MKNKYILLCICLLLNCIVNAQQPEFCGRVDYTFTTNLAYLYSENYTMTFNSQYSYCEENTNDKIDGKHSQEKSEGGVTKKHIIGRQNLKSKYYYKNASEFYFRDNFMDEILIVKEDPLKLNWTLHAETKNLSNFISNKATTTFRGRNYTAWYVMDIPVPFGPWKFHGLPGLIIEVYDTNYGFHLIANNIKIENISCSIKPKPEEMEKALSLQKYLEEKDKIFDRFLAEMSSKRPKGSEPLRRDKNCSDCNTHQIENFND